MGLDDPKPRPSVAILVEEAIEGTGILSCHSLSAGVAHFPPLATDPYVSGFLTPVAVSFFIPLIVY